MNSLSIGMHLRRECRIDQVLYKRNRSEAGGEVHFDPTRRQKSVSYLEIEAHISAAKPVDRLLWIANDEQFAGNDRYLAPIVLYWVSRGEQHEHLRLQRLRILKLVHKDMGESLLKIASDNLVVTQQVARPEQQVKEVQPTTAFL